MLRESSGSSEEAEIVMTRALQVIAEHSQLRADTDGDDTAIDEVGVVFFSPADTKFLKNRHQLLITVFNSQLSVGFFRTAQSCCHVSTCCCC